MTAARARAVARRARELRCANVNTQKNTQKSWSLREFGEKVCFGSPTKHFVIFDLADMFRLDVKETPILRKIY